MAQHWGYHLIVDAASCNISKITNAEHVANFARELVKRIDMVAYGEPRVINFGSGNKAGFTLVQLIETSNIVAHFCNDSGDVYLDVFSCKSFSMSTVLDVFAEYFDPMTMRPNYMTRQA